MSRVFAYLETVAQLDVGVDDFWHLVVVLLDFLLVGFVVGDVHSARFYLIGFPLIEQHVPVPVAVAGVVLQDESALFDLIPVGDVNGDGFGAWLRVLP